MTDRSIDISGQIFGKLTALNRVEKSKNGTWKWRCKCECGNESVVFMTALRAGTTTSCGCLRGKQGTHGMTKTPTYITWKSMWARCTNHKSPDYKWYGGRGITVCSRWLRFENFLEDMGERPADKTLDRYPNVNGNYEPDNCRWATHKEQALNKRSILVKRAGGKSILEETVT
jgi:hypothetical protein